MPHWLIVCICALFAGAAGFYLMAWIHARRRKRRLHLNKNGEKKQFGTMDLILVIVGIALILFTVEMIRIYRQFGTEPSTLETCVFAALGGECGIMGWIKTTKERYREREWVKEDREKAESARSDFPTNNL